MASVWSMLLIWRLTIIPVSRSRMSASIRSFSSGARISRKLTAPILRLMRKYLPSPKRNEDGAIKSFVVSPDGVSQSQEKRNGSPSGWNTLCSSSRVFFFWFCHGWSLLSAHRHRKRTVDFLGCPDGSIKFSWGYPLKELRSSAPLFISS